MDILFATDGRPPAIAAGELLMRLVDPSRVEVTILHALEYGNEVAGESYAEELLSVAETSFGGAGIPTHLVSVEGDPAVSIEKELAHGTQELTVMGAGNHTWLGRIVFGSVSTHVLHVAPTPVLLVHRAPHVDHDKLRVLIGADGSPAAMQAIDTMIALTDPDRVDVAVRTVIQTPNFAFSAHPGAYPPTAYVEEVTDQARKTAAMNLERSLERLRVAGFTAHAGLGTGWPANDLLDRADRDEADIVVVGARGIGTIGRLTMGSVSSHVARHAPAALVAHARGHLVETEEIEEPDGDVSRNRYTVRWG
jgi:nucleotide-binding universal stress UspA family protein